MPTKGVTECGKKKKKVCELNAIFNLLDFKYEFKLNYLAE